MTRLTAAVVREQGVTFAVAVVKDHVLTDRHRADEILQSVARAFGVRLVVLMGERNRRLLGNRQDVVRFVASIDHRRLPWRAYSV